jgi:O-antigen/teichoic acid export membrane protein
VKSNIAFSVKSMIFDPVWIMSVVMRAATFGARVLLVFFLAKHLDPVSMGQYGIFVVTVGYFVFLVGLDFYTYSTRQLISSPLTKQGNLLKSQAVLIGIAYLIILPPATLALARSDWPNPMVWCFPLVLVTEHINQELSRLFVTFSLPVVASVLLFIRQASWVIVIVALELLGSGPTTPDQVIVCWGLAGCAAMGFGVYRLRRLGMLGWSLPVDWGWIRRGLVVSSGFLCGTLAVRGIVTFDRYWVEDLAGIEAVAAYTLFFSIAGVVNVFLDAAIFSFAYPRIIKLVQNNLHQEAHNEIKNLLVQIIAGSACFAIVSYLLLPHILDWVGHPIYKKFSHWYPWLLMAMTVQVISKVPHYGLYALGRDRSIIFSHVFAFFAFGLTTWLFLNVYSAIAVLIGINFAFVSVLVWKSLVYHHQMQKILVMQQ